MTSSELDSLNALGGRRADLSPIPDLEERRLVWFTAFATATVKLENTVLGIECVGDQVDDLLNPENREARRRWRRAEAKRLADKAVADLRLLREDEDRL